MFSKLSSRLPGQAQPDSAPCPPGAPPAPQRFLSCWRGGPRLTPREDLDSYVDSGPREVPHVRPGPCQQTLSSNKMFFFGCQTNF